MTVGQLIYALKQCDPDMEVRFSYNYGDRGSTEVTQHVRTIEQEQPLYWSEYHRAFVRRDEDQQLRHGEEEITVVLLS